MAFDHADIYCRGKAEAVFGAALAKSPGLRDRIFIQTKCGIRPSGSGSWKGWNAPTGKESRGYDPGRYDFSAAWILNSVDASLKRLGCGHIDRLLFAPQAGRESPFFRREQLFRVPDGQAQQGPGG